MILVNNNHILIGSPGCIQDNLFFLVDLTIHFLQCNCVYSFKVFNVMPYCLILLLLLSYSAAL